MRHNTENLKLQFHKQDAAEILGLNHQPQSSSIYKGALFLLENDSYIMTLGGTTTEIGPQLDRHAKSGISDIAKKLGGVPDVYKVTGASDLTVDEAFEFEHTAKEQGILKDTPGHKEKMYAALDEATSISQHIQTLTTSLARSGKGLHHRTVLSLRELAEHSSVKNYALNVAAGVTLAYLDFNGVTNGIGTALAAINAPLLANKLVFDPFAKVHQKAAHKLYEKSDKYRERLNSQLDTIIKNELKRSGHELNFQNMDPQATVEAGFIAEIMVEGGSKKDFSDLIAQRIETIKNDQEPNNHSKPTADETYTNASSFTSSRGA